MGEVGGENKLQPTASLTLLLGDAKVTKQKMFGRRGDEESMGRVI